MSGSGEPRIARWLLAGTIAPRAGLSVYTRYNDVFAWATVVLALAVMFPITRTRRVEMHPNEETEVVFGGEAGRLDARRGLVASLVAGTAALAAAAWGWRRRSADGRDYHEIARWGIPGGQGRFIAVDVEPTPDALRALGERLRQEFDGLDNTVVMVFDDAAAARAVRQGSRVVGEERFHAALAHQRAMYTKQTARGEHALTIYARYPEVTEVVRYDGARPPVARGTRPPLHAGIKVLLPIVALSLLAAACAKRPATTAVTAPAPTGQVGATPQARAAEPAAPSTPTPAGPGTRVTPGGPGAPRDGATVTTPGAPTTRPSPREFTAVPELKEIHFDFDKYDIRPGDARILDDNARWMKANPDDLVLIARTRVSTPIRSSC